MKKLKIELLPVSDGDIVRGSVIRERKKGGGWEREEVYRVASGTPGASREILLDDDERLVIEAEQTHNLVFDRDQNVAKLEPADPAAAHRKRESDAKIRAENIARETRGLNVEGGELGRRTTLGRPLPPEPPHLSPLLQGVVAPPPPPRPEPPRGVMPSGMKENV